MCREYLNRGKDSAGQEEQPGRNEKERRNDHTVAPGPAAEDQQAMCRSLSPPWPPAHYFPRGLDSSPELSPPEPVPPDDRVAAFVSIFWNMSHEAMVPVT